MTFWVTFFYHTGGRFVRDSGGVLKYLNGKLGSFPRIDVDLVNYFDIIKLLDAVGHNGFKEMLWMHPNKSDFDTGLSVIRGDKDINEMCDVAIERGGNTNRCDIHLYFDLFKGNGAAGVHKKAQVHSSSTYSDDYDSAEDSAYKPPLHHDTDSYDSDSYESEDDLGLTGKKKKSKRKRQEKATNEGNEGNEEFSFEVAGYASYSEQMHTPVSTDDEGISKLQVFPIFKETTEFGHVHLQAGMEFDTLELFKNAVRDYNINLGREIKWKKNDKVRVRAVCLAADCDWLVYCAWNSRTRTYQIKTFVEDHSCCRVFQNKAANRVWVAKKLEQRLLTQPELKRSQAYDLMKEDFQVHLNEKKLSRALKQARIAVEGSEKDQYGRLWDYLNELLKSNPRSTAKMEVIPRPESLPLFNRLYICLEGCREGFKKGCRPLIGLDGCFLKGYFGGQLLSAVGQDANNQFYVIAYVVVDSETKDNWKWFLELLEGDIGDHMAYGWNFISDQQKGLLPALKEVMPGAYHRNCVLHIWKNFIKKWRDQDLRGVVWDCAKSTTETEFKARMQRLKETNERAWSYLNNIDPRAWVKAYFSHWPKLDNITNNMCEVWNAKIVNYREKPILTMLEELRCYLMRRIQAHKRMMGSYRRRIPPVQQKKLDKLKVESNKWTPTFTGDPDNETFEVQRRRTKVGVSLTQQTCTCQQWQLTGMPCCHAIAAIAYKNERPEDHVHQWLTVDALAATYEHYIHPVASQQYWDETGRPMPEPPKLKRPIGRPKKHRRKDMESEEAPGSQQHKIKKTWEVTCKKCGETGHFEKTCKGPARPKPIKATSTRRTTKKKSNTQQESQPVTQEHTDEAVPVTTQAQTETVTEKQGGPHDNDQNQELQQAATEINHDNQELYTPPPPPGPAVRPPPIRPAAVKTPPAMAPAFTASSPVGTISIRSPGPPVRQYRPPRLAAQQENAPAETSATTSFGDASMVFQFIPTPGYRAPPPSSKKT